MEEPYRLKQCAECGGVYFVDEDGAAYHHDPGEPDGIDHERDANHVPHGD